MSTMLKHVITYRQSSHIERGSEDCPIQKERKTSTGYLERKTRHGSVISVDNEEEPQLSEADVRKERLIKTLKKEVKQIMENAPNRRRISIHSTYVTSLCAAVENCLMDGLKRRLLGLFGAKSTFALLHSIAKHCGAAATVLNLTTEHANRESSSSNANFLWLRLALLEKSLSTIVDFVHSSVHCRRFYEKDALMLDPVRGGMIAAILVAPSALDYTILKPSMDIGYRDPTADELVMRHRITSAPSTSPTLRRPPLTVMKRGNSLIRSAETSIVARSFSRDYVFSLHQNMRSSLLYGKNNVTVTTIDGAENLKGYLSLHQENSGSLFVKWTPNQLMHSSSQPSPTPQSAKSPSDPSWLWKYAININMQSIIYLHLHQHGEQNPATLVFVDMDGVQYSPFQFPPGQHCLAFLSCLENGLSPFYRLDPPLWNEKGKGKILPRLRRRRTSASTSSEVTSNSSDEINEIYDYVFRIVPMGIPSMQAKDSLNNKEITTQIDDITFEDESVSTSTPPKSPKHWCSMPSSPYINSEVNGVDGLVKHSLVNACQTMRQQILSRAFYGWLSYCRHLKTIRTHLSCLVNMNRIIESSEEFGGPVDDEFWDMCRKEKTEDIYRKFLRRVYLHGIEPHLRYRVWPYLLGLIDWNSEIEDSLPDMTTRFNKDLAQWSEIEAEVIRRDHEAFQAARLRQSSNNCELNFPPDRQISINNDVFEDGAESSSNLLHINGGCKDDQNDVIEEFGLNLHRIEKDVERCDRNTDFFSKRENLNKLKRIMCTYIWRHLNDGYTQGMCDIAAPLLVIFQNEILALEMFELLMERMRVNFPHGEGIERQLSNLRSLVQVMDPELFELMMSNADFTQLYFAYRWLLLDFKRELTYDGVYKLWEVIWASHLTVSEHFPLFFGLALLTQYRSIVIENNMDFTDCIKFYNEMAEKHDADELISTAREKLYCLQQLVLELNG